MPLVKSHCEALLTWQPISPMLRCSACASESSPGQESETCLAGDTFKIQSYNVYKHMMMHIKQDRYMHIFCSIDTHNVYYINLVILMILGFFSSSFSRKIHNPWVQIAPPRTHTNKASRGPIPHSITPPPAHSAARRLQA